MSLAMVLVMASVPTLIGLYYLITGLKAQVDFDSEFGAGEGR